MKYHGKWCLHGNLNINCERCKLEAERDRYKEALEEIAKLRFNPDESTRGAYIAKQALEGKVGE